MKSLLGLLAILLLALSLTMGTAPMLAQEPTPTPTPFVIPFINVPIVLPTGISGPFPTPITIHYTPAPNLNPLNLDVNQVDMAFDALNISVAIKDAMGVTGNILAFLAGVMMAAGIGKKLRNRLDKRTASDSGTTRRR